MGKETAEDFWAGAEPGDYSALVAKAGPCRLGGQHTEPRFNGMVYCEHGVSVFFCKPCQGLPDDYNPICEECNQPKDQHTEAEAAYCITRGLSRMLDKPVHVTGP